MSATRAGSARGATRQAESGAALVVTVRSAHGLRPTRCTRKHGVFLWLAHGASAQAATEVTDHDLVSHVKGEADWEGETFLIPVEFDRPRTRLHCVWCCAHTTPRGHCPGRLAEASVDVTDTVKGGRYARMAVPLDDTRSTRRASSDIMLFIGVRAVPIGSAATIIAHLPTRSLPNADDRSREVTRALTPRGGRRKTRDRSASRHSASSLESHVTLVSVGSLDPSGGSSSSSSSHKSDDDDTLGSSVQSEPGAGPGPGAGQGMPVHVVGGCAPDSRDPHLAAPKSPPSSCIDSGASGGVDLAYGFAARTLGASRLSVDVRGGTDGSGAMAVVVSPKHPDDVIRKLFSYYSNAGSGTVTLKDLVVGLHKKYVAKLLHDPAARKRGSEEGAVHLALCAARYYFRCAGLTAHDAMTLDHFRRWCRGSPVCDDLYMPVPLVPIPQGNAAVTPPMRVIREEPDADDPMALAPMLLHFVPGHTLEKRISAAFASMDVRQAGVVSRSELEAGVARFYEKAIALGLRVEEEVERPKGFHRGFSGASHGDDIQAVAGELARKLASTCHAAGSDTTTSPDTVTQAQFTAWAARVLRQ